MWAITFVIEFLIVWPAIILLLLAGVVYFNRAAVESKVGRLLCSVLTWKLGTKVSFDTFQIRWESKGYQIKGIDATGVIIDNDPRGQFEVPYCAKIGRFELRTSGMWGLLSLPGILRFGRYEREIRIGFTTRVLDVMKLSDVQVHICDGNDTETGESLSNVSWLEGVKSKKRNKRERVRLNQKEFIAQWRAHWKNESVKARHSRADIDCIAEDSDSEEETEPDAQNTSNISNEVPKTVSGRLRYMAKAMHERKGDRMETLHSVKAAFKEADKQDKEVQKLTKQRQLDSNAQQWRIGRLCIYDCVVLVNGTDLHLNKGYTLNAFIGNFTRLKSKLIKGLLSATVHDTIVQRHQNRKEKVHHRMEQVNSVLQKVPRPFKNMLHRKHHGNDGDDNTNQTQA